MYTVLTQEEVAKEGADKKHWLDFNKGKNNLNASFYVV